MLAIGRRSRVVAVAVLAAITARTARAQTPDPAPDSLVAAVEAAMTNGHLPGAQVLVSRNGQVVLDRGFGVQSLTAKRPVDPDTRFEIGSITKQFTAAAIMQLVERHKLSLDDSLGKFVHDYPAAARVTLRQLLWQVTGIPNYTAVSGFVKYSASHPGGIEGVLGLIRAKPLEFAPGTKWMYSNTNYALLGQVVAVVSGESWEAYIKGHIFGPLGMTHSTFVVDEGGLRDFATGYTRMHGARASSPPMGNWALGAGSIVSTAEDLAKWDEAFFGGRVISPADVKLATTPGRLASGTPTDYGFGWLIDSHDGQPCIEHNGGTFGFASVNQNFPDLGERIIVLVNDAGGGPTAIATAAFEALNPGIVSAADAPAAGEDAAITKLAQQWWQALVSGKLDRSRLTPAMNTALTPAVVHAAGAQFGALGTPVRWIYRGKQEAPGSTTYRYRVSFGGGTVLNVFMSIATDGKLAGYLARPG